MRPLPTLIAATLLLATACGADRVTVGTPTTQPNGNSIAENSTPAPTSANTVDAVPARVAIEDTTARPQWLKARIAETLGHRKQYPVVRIYRYVYNDQTVYWETAPCCDQQSTVYDTRGNVLCHPDGGITGKGDGQCANFEKRKANEKLVWQDPR
ncbi:DUF6970 domain-containing protein [Hymenobacter nivis]|uniref:DUF6970 domain-containing protein n=1 Tax=Hymenobacter nivis TaxID=1850093 RepID=A0A502GPT7_9BACT|nr:hypothetical protein [Hymenobacter nivis]TPG63016.1 hypothetical protein EAH73_18335 [Hymenobacter nivis]